jgi:secreted PhoX family phosphatase
MTPMKQSRRTFMRRATGAAGAAFLAPSLAGLVARSRGILGAAEPAESGAAVKRAGLGEGGYGALRAAGPELALPEGFSYTVIGFNGKPMTDGSPTPGAFDGMAAFGMPNGNVRLLRNHENRDTAQAARVKGNPARAYDTRAGGGVSTVEVRIGANGVPEVVREFMSLNGTLVNCAGGPTPWGSWLTCEETVAGPANGYERRHGYVFEVSAKADAEVAAIPFKAMGRFVHEAVAVDPNSGIVYETEDQVTAGFYRFIPNRRGDLAAGGRLQMLAVRDRPRYDTSKGQTPGLVLGVHWVDIDDPDPNSDAIASLAVYNQGAAKGGARFARLEGCWSGDGGIYFHATSGGDAAAGQVWRYQPGRFLRGDRLTLVFESPSREVLEYPDNIMISPRGGIVICEDGSGVDHVRGLTPRGEIFDVARNIMNDGEFAGACFSPDGRILFVNIQGATTDAGTAPDRTLAIRGPWEKGAL